MLENDFSDTAYNIGESSIQLINVAFIRNALLSNLLYMLSSSSAKLINNRIIGNTLHQMFFAHSSYLGIDTIFIKNNTFSELPRVAECNVNFESMKIRENNVTNDMIYVENNVTNDMIYVENNVTYDMIYVGNNVTNDMIYVGNNVTNDMIYVENNVTNDMIYVENNVTYDMIYVGNNVTNDMIYVENNVTNDMIYVENNVTNDMIYVENNVTNDMIYVENNVTNDMIYVGNSAGRMANTYIENSDNFFSSAFQTTWAYLGNRYFPFEIINTEIIWKNEVPISAKPIIQLSGNVSLSNVKLLVISLFETEILQYSTKNVTVPVNGFPRTFPNIYIISSLFIGCTKASVKHITRAGSFRCIPCARGTYTLNNESLNATLSFQSKKVTKHEKTYFSC